jgi:ABC-2 type transport system permease protein
MRLTWVLTVSSPTTSRAAISPLDSPSATSRSTSVSRGVLAEEPALRAVVGSGLYLALVGLLSLGVGMIVRHTAVAITIMFGLLLVPFIAALLLPEHPRELVQRYSPMTAGLAIQRTVERIDSVPIGVWAGLGVLAGWAVAALVGAFVMINRRGA